MISNRGHFLPLVVKFQMIELQGCNALFVSDKGCQITAHPKW
jgi:hypothetical protein